MGHILIAHASKVIRATLAKHLEGSLSVLEVLEGDSAWQTLVLDHDISGVIAEPDLPRLNGLELLERLRESRLQRLHTMPFYFIGSETKIAEIKEQAMSLGATGFLTSGMDKASVLEALQGLFPKFDQEIFSEPEQAKKSRAAGLLSATLFEEELEQFFVFPGVHGSLLFFGLNHYPDLVDRLGKSVSRRLVDQLAEMLQDKIGPEDFIGRHGPGSFVIASKGTDLTQCAAFAQRVIRNVEAAKVKVRGKLVQMEVSACAVSSPEDGPLSGRELLALGAKRLEQAMLAGPGKIMIYGGD